MFHSPAHASTSGYRLLELDGHKVKWGDPQLGRAATVSYAFADQALRFDDAHNCRELSPIRELVGKSLSMGTLARETEAAFRLWERAAGLIFREVDHVRDADIVLGVQGLPRGRAFANVSYKPEAERGIRTIEQALVCLNPDQQWKVGFDGNESVYDIRYTLIHEIGHAIGLDHPGRSGQVMAFRYSEAFDSLQPGDLRGARRLYGRPVKDTIRWTAPPYARQLLARLIADKITSSEARLIRGLFPRQFAPIAVAVDEFGRFLGIGEKAGAAD